MRVSQYQTDLASILKMLRLGELAPDKNALLRPPLIHRYKQLCVQQILGGFSLPSIYVVKQPRSQKVRLVDGRRWLEAAQEFAHSKFPIDSKSDAFVPGLEKLDGKRFGDLPDDLRLKFSSYTLDVNRVDEFEEIELANFLNMLHPDRETHEAAVGYSGGVWAQVYQLAWHAGAKQAVEKLCVSLRSSSSYLELIGRVLLVMESRNFAMPIYCKRVQQFLQRDELVPAENAEPVRIALERFVNSSEVFSAMLSELNRSTLFSWLLFVARTAVLGIEPSDPIEMGLFVGHFNSLRQSILRRRMKIASGRIGTEPRHLIFDVYNVQTHAKIISVRGALVRDAVLWIAYDDFLCTQHLQKNVPGKMLATLRKCFQASAKSPSAKTIANRLMKSGWGQF
jgi:hypothetical protein